MCTGGHITGNIIILGDIEDLSVFVLSMLSSNKTDEIVMDVGEG